MTYSSNCHKHFIVSCFNKHRLTQVHLEKWLFKMDRESFNLFNAGNISHISINCDGPPVLFNRSTDNQIFNSILFNFKIAYQ